MWGRYLEVIFPDEDESQHHASSENNVGSSGGGGDGEEGGNSSHPFGLLLMELFSDIFPPMPVERLGGMRLYDNNLVEAATGGGCRYYSEMPARKKTQQSMLRCGTYEKLIERGYPSSISSVVQNLLECVGEENRLGEAIEDLHLLIFDPSRFLFDREIASINGCTEFSIKDRKLYGREHEVSLITDAFCRVSEGKSEAFFLGGFSGSGKSMIVNSLIARVNVSGGSVLMHKFDQISKDRPMLDLLVLFNDLCLMISERYSHAELAVIVNDLEEVFGSDLSVLARMLPDIRALIPRLEQYGDKNENEGGGNLRSICFTLQRFIRVVSSEKHPVVLILDDLQWCDESAFAVVESLLCDGIGPNCVFFVGTYRSNEVADDHEIFLLMQKMKLFGVPTTVQILEGLNPNDLNIMISDALCALPRISKPLSNIIHQKTKGNPFFVLAFLKSLVEVGSLEYSIRKRRWFWDEEQVSSMDVTGNVLHLLTSKMSRLSASIQAVLKLAACFGAKIKESVVITLAVDPGHSDILDKFEQVVEEGFMVKSGLSEFKFVHDKVREAAYSLMSESEKSQYHYSIGMSLYATTRGKDVNDVIIYNIIDQIKRGIAHIEGETPQLRADIAKITAAAVLNAMASSDYVTAFSYSMFALSLLPINRWESHYDLSLWFSIQSAKSYFSVGNVGKARCILREIMDHCHTLEEKLPAYFLLALIELPSENSIKSYSICHDVLTQLGEYIPNGFYRNQIANMFETTSVMVERIVSETDLLDMKKMDGMNATLLDFYGIMSSSAMFARPEMRLFLICRKVQLTMTSNTLCEESIMGLLEFASVLCIKEKGVIVGSRLGKVAMSCFNKRYRSTRAMSRLYLLYYSLIAFHTEPLQSCADMLRLGFDVGMSAGETIGAFFSAVYHIKTALATGERLPTLLDKVDYYLGLAEIYQHKFGTILLSITRDTISTLIGKAGLFTPISNFDAPAGAPEFIIKASLTRSAVVAFWQGHCERCQFYVEKLLKLSSVNYYRESYFLDEYLVTLVIHGLNSFQVLRTRNIRSGVKIKSVPKKAIKTLTDATALSSWNFRNKVHLLEAEQFSFQNNNQEALLSYAAAINSACSSKFIHEQGLACELAGYHCKKNCDLSGARKFFDQAKKCYADWGSQLKVDSVAHALESV
ncbi:LOW QUALITY PROTEIN: hypothetical protein ACHAXA_010789 [Cyclostephanos tholiformis]|uniref:Orc1-like AAA ATPase domain-containing protein n=1 Tax=Cyclostephanos tholiformis TaxID=382380 RepID=A0ABD3RSY0_9STRA